jgi:peptidoglycan lytic transglycosylase D
MKTPLACLLLLFPVLGANAASLIPEPEALEPDVHFWMRVYSEISTNAGYIHDQRNLAIVYQTLHFDPAAPPRAREQQVTAAREHYQSILRQFGSGAAPQNAEEQRVLELWAGADPARLRQAAEDVRFQLGQSDRFRAGLQRAGIWESHIAQTLAAQGLPPEIAALPHVESSFQPTAMSKAGAAGMWQFIRSTGRRYLRIDGAVDERLDPYRSTEAAAQLLSYNYRVLGSWPLAITAYNHGAEGMRRARDQLGTDDIVRIVRQYQSPTFGFASRNYYCSFLAAMRLDRDPEKYFGSVTPQTVPDSHELQLLTPVRADSLAAVLHLDRDTLRSLNPALRNAVWSLQRLIPRGYRLRLPESMKSWTGELLATQLSHGVTSSEPALTVAQARPPSRAPTPKTVPAVVAAVVQPPVSHGPAARAGLSAAELAAASAAYDAMYIVRGGDTLAMIALRTGVDPARLIVINGLSDGEHIYEGQRLELEGGPAHVGADALLAAQAVAEDRQDQARQVAAARSQPAVSAAQAQAQGPALLADAVPAPSADPIDYGVDSADRVVVVAAETIGHYADWLDLPVANLRALNHLRARSAVLIGSRFKLSFAKVPRPVFEQRRRDYHQQLEAEYFAAHRIAGSDTYVARRGDSLWSVTQRGAMPVWLLQQYNPDVDFAVLRPGTVIVLPRVVSAS